MDDRIYANALFAGIPREELARMAIPIEECRFGRDEIIFDEGDPGEHVYLVLEGAVCISKKGRGGKQETLTVQGSGGFFGEMALLDGLPRSARATASEPSVLGGIDRDGLYRLVAHSPESALQFTRLMTQHLRSSSSLFIQELLRAERLSLLGTMMGSIVHDFKSPLGTLSFVGDQLSSMKGHPELEELGDITSHEVSRILDMIQELLDFSRGTSTVRLMPTTVEKLLGSLNREILDSLPAEGIEVRRQVDYRGELRVDSPRLLRLFYNLVKNSREAMPDGGVLMIGVRSVGDMVEFSMVDTGCGIPSSVLPQVFDPFVTHGKSGGTGLGMAIAKSVAEAHGGGIRMESKEGKGTVCTVVLPKGSGGQ